MEVSMTKSKTPGWYLVNFLMLMFILLFHPLPAHSASGDLMWSFPLTGEVKATPTIKGSMVIIGDMEGKLFARALDDGTSIWERSLTKPIRGSVTPFQDRIYVGAGDGLYCLEALTGKTIWYAPTYDQIGSTPAYYRGRLYVGCDDGRLYCFDAKDGKEVWHYQTNEQIDSSPAIYHNRVLFGSRDDNFYCLDAETGELKWKFQTGGDIVSSPCVGNGLVYLASYDHKVYCLNVEDGTPKWEFQTESTISQLDISSSPALADGKLLVGSYDKNLYALNITDGQVLWKYYAGFAISSSPAVSGTRVYIGDNEGVVHCIDMDTGEAVWTQSPNYPESEAFHYCSPVLQQGNLFISGRGNPSTGQKGKLYALHACCPASPPWTKFRHNPQNTGDTSFVFNYGTESLQIPLAQGWNLVGASLNPNIPYVDSLFQDIEDYVASAWKWDSSNNNWQVYLPGEANPGAYAKAKGFSDWDDLSSGAGFWLNIKPGCDSMTLTGRSTTDTDLNLAKGWNLVALKSSSTLSVSKYLGDLNNKIADVTNSIASAWMWDTEKNTWRVHIPYMTTDDLDSYINQKGFLKLTSITGNNGFWINVTKEGGATLPEAPPSLVATDSQGVTTLGNSNVQLFLAGKIAYQKTPLGGADLLTKEKDGKYTVFMKSPDYTYNSATIGEGENGYLYVQKVDKKKEEVQQKGSLVTGEWNIDCEEPAEIPKPTPKVISSSDGSTALVITNMVLMSDITVAVTPYKSPLYVPNINALKDDIPSFTGNIITLGGADVCVVDSNGNKTDSTKAGFCASVSPSTSSFFNTITPAEADEIVNTDKKANIYLLFFRDGHWHKLGSARLEKITTDTYALMPGSSVYMKRLYSFLFVLMPVEPPTLQGTISGKVFVKGTTDVLPGVQVALKDGEGFFITDTDGAFSLPYSLPGNAGQEATLLITAQKPGYENGVAKVAVSAAMLSPTDIKIDLEPVPATFEITGKVSDSKTKAPLENALIHVFTPAVLNDIEVSPDGQTITTGYSGTASYTWEVLDGAGNILKTVAGQGKNTLAISDLGDGVLTAGTQYELHLTVAHMKEDMTFSEKQTGFILPEGDNGFKFQMLPKSSLPPVILGKTDSEGDYKITGLSIQLKGFLTARADKEGYYLSPLYQIGADQTSLAFELTPQKAVTEYIEDFEETEPPPGWESSGDSDAVKWNWQADPETIEVCSGLADSILYADFPTLDAEGTITSISEAGVATIDVPSLGKQLTRTLIDTDGNGTYDHITQDWSTYNNAKYLVYVAGDDPNLEVNDSVEVAYPEPGAKVHLLPAASGSHVFWYGNTQTGTYSDQCDNTSSSENKGTLKSKVIDLTDFAHATLYFNTWYEVESVDIAKGQYDKMLIEFAITDDDKTENDTVDLNWQDKSIQIKAQTRYQLDSLNPDKEPPNLQKSFVPYSCSGVAAAPVWVSREYNLDPLVGHKIRLYFYFETKDKNYNGFRGWAIDDVKIKNQGSDLDFLIPQVPSLAKEAPAARKDEG